MVEPVEILARNLLLLEGEGALRDAIRTLEPYPEAAVGIARSGDPIIELGDDAGIVRPLHSRYDPRGEARTLLPAEQDPLATYILLGAGLGYAALELAPRLSAENHLYWIEADPRLFRTLLERFDFAPVLARARTHLFVGREPREVFERLCANAVALLAAPIHLVAHPPSLQRQPEIYAEHRRAIGDFSRHGSLQLRTTLRLGRRTLENQAANLGRYIGSPGIAPFRGAMRGQPIIIAAAGPSLRRNADLLREAAGRIPILAVSTALRLLLGRGIRPDFTALIDHHRMSRRYFEGIAAEDAPPMITEARAAHEAVAGHRGACLFASDRLLDLLLEGIIPAHGALRPTSSVASTAFQFACWMEADPIVFVGLDLSYPGGLLHVPGTAVHNSVVSQVNRFYTLETRELEYYLALRGRMRMVPAIPEGEVPTEDVLYSYIKELEEAFREYDGEVIDATEGGARLEGTEIATLAEVVARHRDARAPDLARVLDGARARIAAEPLHAAVIERLEDVASEVAAATALYGRIVPAIERVVDRTARGEAADSEVREIQLLEREAAKRRRAVAYLKLQSQAELLARFRDDRRLDTSRATGAALQREQAERDLPYVRALVAAGREASAFFDAACGSVNATRAAVS